jgi:phosphoesterase RecJ-like protein
MSTIVNRQIKELIDQAQHILLLTDERIDGDTIGSTLGMFHVLSAAGKRVTVFSPKALPSALAFLPGVEVIRRDEAVFEDSTIDLAIIFDCSDGAYIKNFLPLMKRPAPLIVFDHHLTNPRYGQINVIEPEAAATADVVWRFVKAAGYEVNRSAAQCILTGICTDTAAFSTTNTTAACLEAAHELAKLGAKLQEIVRHTMMSKSEAAMKLWGLALSRLYEDSTFEAIATVITRKDLAATGAVDDDVEGLSNFLNAMVDGAETVLVLRETSDGAVKGSLRSVTRDVAAVATKYGGGGHKTAAGFKVANSILDEKDGQWYILNK